MFKTHMGPVEEDAAVVYLRPETAQGSYVNFKNVQQSSRKKLPFGIAQVGKSFRNEISPGNFVFRMREFEQMEMQYFVRPDAAAGIFEEWLPRRWDWYTSYGVTPSRLRFREHAPDELAHYAKKAVDIEYRFPFGWKELEGIHNRGDFDLSRHAEASGENLEYFDPATEDHFIPFIVETAGGPDRAAFTFLIDSYREEEVRGEKRVVLGLHPDLAPYKVAVLPLLKKRPEIVELCHRLRADLARHVIAVYDDTAAIGKLYRRQDEIGTPWCVTIDVESLDDGAATVRDRDTMIQERIPIEGLVRADPRPPGGRPAVGCAPGSPTRRPAALVVLPGAGPWSGVWTHQPTRIIRPVALDGAVHPLDASFTGGPSTMVNAHRQRTSRARLATLAAGMLLGGWLVAVPSVSATPASGPGAVSRVTAGTLASGTIPDGTCRASVAASGGGGASSPTGVGFGGRGGSPAVIGSTFAVLPGQTYTGSVGGGGTVPTGGIWQCSDRHRRHGRDDRR